MSKDKNAPSLPSTGIYIEKGFGNQLSNITSVGYDVGIRFDEAYNNKFSSVQVISLDALTVLEQTKIQLLNLNIDEKLKNEINNKLDEIKTAPSKESASNSYIKLMSSLSDHVTVLTPLWPHLCTLAGSLIA
ncbi:hypothetical protein PN368_001530 [Escherichia coli]|uniref:Uncharacterized protein n=1 Tax=Escherichia marmotae TaxID=1499973 RepID=A0A7L6L860_9ESCH|nr:MULTISPECIES: hypothetical protein [Escherichia]EED0757216.1 hypothetical protein [Escherichia coli]EFA4452102.1 hypothetical protein [Escherichia coli]EFJ2964288.1 hypothetical protein [Escherichia coli]EFN8343136.1 hypothetical protein [Escherichia coli]EFO0427437.1 hypothetical protein [Escherichia coli]